MGWGMGWALLGALLATGPALRCPSCDVIRGCRPVACPSPTSVCRRTTLVTLRDGRELRREEGGCDVTGPPDVVITFLSHGEHVTLREQRWGAGPAPGHAPEPNGTAPGSPPRLCPTCSSPHGSCWRPLAALPCPSPTDLCLSLSWAAPPPVGAGQLRGCGSAGSGRGLLALHTGSGRRVELRSCESDQCEPDPPPSGLQCWAYDGPAPSDHAPDGHAPQVLTCGAGLTQCALAWSVGPSGEPWLLQGCASPTWCQAPMGLGGLWGSPVGQGEESVGLGEESVGLGGESMGQGEESMGLGEESVGLGGESMGLGGESMGPEKSMGLGKESVGPGKESVGLGKSVGQLCCRGSLCNALPSPNAAPSPPSPLPHLLLLLPLPLLLAAPQV